MIGGREDRRVVFVSLSIKYSALEVVDIRKALLLLYEINQIARDFEGSTEVALSGGTILHTYLVVPTCRYEVTLCTSMTLDVLSSGVEVIGVAIRNQTEALVEIVDFRVLNAAVLSNDVIGNRTSLAHVAVSRSVELARSRNVDLETLSSLVFQRRITGACNQIVSRLALSTFALESS